jgi:DNA-binding GntR family transcriptional regulator
MTTGAASEALDSLEIKRSSAVDQVADAVGEMILAGKLAPGTPLREVELAASVGISRNTVRDAFRVLARQGLVTHTMNRGAVVARLTERDVSDLFTVRRVIEMQAIDSCSTASAEQLRELRAALRQLRLAAEEREWTGIAEADCRFHQCLVGFLGSPRLDHFFDTIQGELRLCLSIVDRDNDEAVDLVAEHEELYALIAGNESERCKAMLAHCLDEAEERLSEIAREIDLSATDERGTVK